MPGINSPTSHKNDPPPITGLRSETPQLNHTDHLDVKAALTGDVQVRIQVKQPTSFSSNLPNRAARFINTLYNNHEIVLLMAALLVYLVTRLIQLPAFPIYFFTDEAVQTVLASDLVLHGFTGSDSVYFPTYFLNTYQYNLGLSVYLQVIPFLLFGKSIWITRGISALFSGLAALSVGLTLRKIFKISFAWAGVLFLAAFPAWFLHSRTAFETVLATTFFALFFYFYGLYRTVSRHYMLAALLCAGLCFYSYSPIRLVIGLACLLLLISDWQYHFADQKTVILAIIGVFLIAAPFIRFLFIHPEENAKHLALLDSYWVKNIPFIEKLLTYIMEYARGFNPAYWFWTNNRDLARHIMKGYGHLPLFAAPFLFTGMVLTFIRLRQPIYRALLIFVLVIPSGAALVEIGITRVLAMVIPIALLCGLGFSFLAEKASIYLKKSLVSGLCFLVLGFFSFNLLADALKNGPTWFDNYGLDGMQYGAQQVYKAAFDYLEEHPAAQIILSPSWSNGTDMLQRFFAEDDMRISLESIDGFMVEEKKITPEMVFIMLPDEFERAAQSDKFTDITVLKQLPYPNGQPGFLFVKLHYVDNAAEIFKAEKEARRALVLEEFAFPEQTVKIEHSTLDMGSMDQLFDGNLSTLVRTFEANPFQILLTYPTSQTASSITFQVGGPPTRVSLDLIDEKGAVSQHFVKEVREEPDPRPVTFTFDTPQSFSKLKILIKSLDTEEPAHVHLWEIIIKP
jgi:4-amino-4-deoxy-L-arabinose transferase-like glycosyltransferase